MFKFVLFAALVCICHGASLFAAPVAHAPVAVASAPVAYASHTTIHAAPAGQVSQTC